MNEMTTVLYTLNLADRAHSEKNQRYGIYPYKKHLLDVFSIALEFGISNLAILQAILVHDVLEDTDMSFNSLQNHVGTQVADMVWAVTNEDKDDKGNLLKNRKEKFVYTYAKINSIQDSIYVKLCDRIANVRNSITAFDDIGTKKAKYYSMYKKEYGSFRKNLKQETTCTILNALWAELDRLMLWRD